MEMLGCRAWFRERIFMITSLTNKTVKDVVALGTKAKVRREKDLFVTEGGKMFAEAPVDRIAAVYVAASAEKNLLAQYGDKLKQTGYETVSDDVFHKMSDTKTPQGILCLLKQYHYAIDELLSAKKNALVMLLEDIQDPGNLGTIFRTGEGAGIDGVIMSRNTADLYNPKTIRSTMGSIYRVPFVYVEDLQETIRELQKKEIKVYAAHLAGEKYYDECDFSQGTAFLIGNEGNGLRKETAECADIYMKIPMEGRVESLNAAIASSVLMYEAYRQRRGGK